MKSNCNLEAWERFRKGETDRMIFTKTKWSRWQVIAAQPWWQKTVKPIGYLIGYPAWLAVQCAWVLMFGTWAHVTWIDRNTGAELEFSPLEPKTDKLFPPIHYEGEVREVADS